MSPLDRVDSSGIRFYVTDQLRQYDIGYLTFGTDPTPISMTIPPQMQEFTIDSYCPQNATQVRVPDQVDTVGYLYVV